MSTLTAPAPTRLSPKLQQIRTQIHALSQQERQVLLQALLAEESQTNGASAEPTRFVVPVQPTPLEPALLSQAPPVRDIAALVADWWPEEETADDINDFVRQMRQADLALEQQREREYGNPLA